MAAIPPSRPECPEGRGRGGGQGGSNANDDEHPIRMISRMRFIAVPQSLGACITYQDMHGFLVLDIEPCLEVEEDCASRQNEPTYAIASLRNMDINHGLV